MGDSGDPLIWNLNEKDGSKKGYLVGIASRGPYQDSHYHHIING